MRFIRETNHSSAIICGKLYRTNNAEVIGEQNGRKYFMTLRRNFFSAKCEFEDYQDAYGDAHIIAIYSDIRMESVEKAKEILGFTDVKRYCEVFGQVEEA